MDIGKYLLEDSTSVFFIDLNTVICIYRMKKLKIVLYAYMYIYK